MQCTSSVSELQLERPELLVTARRAAESFYQHGYMLLKLQKHQKAQLEAARAALRDHAERPGAMRGVTMPPSKQLLGRNVYSYRLNQEALKLPANWSKSVQQVCHRVLILRIPATRVLCCLLLSILRHLLQAFKVLQHAGEAVLAVLTKSYFHDIRTTAFNDILDDPVLKSGQMSSSALAAVHYLSASNISTSGGCQPHVHEGSCNNHIYRC